MVQAGIPPMNRRTYDVIGEIDSVVLVDQPDYLRVVASYCGRDLVLTIIHQPPLRGPVHAPTKSSQSPGVDIDAVHLKYAGENHVKKP
jgi:hypothetical protein